MYPYARYATALRRARREGPVDLFATHVCQQRCWPWDIDPWGELNNGRTLTLYDLGRMPIAGAPGLIEALRRERWAMAVAGLSVRYRRRIRAFHRFTMLSRLLGWDGRFFYIEQSMWRGGECANHLLLRTAISSAEGIVAPATVLATLGLGTASPPLPGWVRAWIDADARRPWPPLLAPDVDAPRAITRAGATGLGRS